MKSMDSKSNVKDKSLEVKNDLINDNGVVDKKYDQQENKFIDNTINIRTTLDCHRLSLDGSLMCGEYNNAS